MTENIKTADIKKRHGAEAWSLRGKGLITQHNNDYEGAFGLYNQALELFQEENDEEGIGCLLQDIGIIYKFKGDYEKSLECFEKSLEMEERRKDWQEIASSLSQIGQVLELKGDLDSSLEHHQKALKIHKEIGNRKGEAVSLTSLGSVLREKGELESSMKYHQEALKISEELQDVREQSASWNLIGLVYSQMENWQLAVECEQKSLLMEVQTNDLQGQAFSHFNLGYRLFHYLNDKKKALFHLRKSVEIQERLEIDHEGMLTAKEMIHEIEAEFEKEKNTALREICKGTKFKDYHIVKKVGGTEFSRSISRSRSHHGACSSVFFVKLAQGNFDAVMKIHHRIGKEKLSKEEYDRIVKENQISDVNSEFVMNLCHHFVDEFNGILEDLEISKETVFLIFPRAEKDLCHLIQEQKKKGQFPFAELEFLRLTKQMLEAITSLHQQGIVHLDIKTDNFLISSRGNVLITDFEFQKVFSPESEFKVKFKSGFTMGGAKFYLPPEICSNEKEGNFLDYSKSDVFGVGFAAFSLLCEDDPFCDVSSDERSVGNYISLPEEISDEVRFLVDGMIHPDFSKRLTCYEALEICSKLHQQRLDEENTKNRIQFQTLTPMEPIQMKILSKSIQIKHYEIICDSCLAEEWVGRRFKCSSCPKYPGYDLCGKCFEKLKQKMINHEHEIGMFEEV